MSSDSNTFWTTARSDFCCIFCGGLIGSSDSPILSARKSWQQHATANRFSTNAKPLIVSAREVEELDSPQDPTCWLDVYRVIRDEPQTRTLLLSGISSDSADLKYQGWNYAYATHNSTVESRSVPRDPRRARLNGAVIANNQHHASYRAANIFGVDKGAKTRVRTGYPMHIPCWLLLDRVVKHATVLRNLAAFVDSVRAFWRDNNDNDNYNALQHWGRNPRHYSEPRLDCFSQGSFRASGGNRGGGSRVYHAPGNPFRVPEIRELCRASTEVSSSPSSSSAGGKGKGFKISSSSIASRVPLDIAMLILDAIASAPLSAQRVNDTRNILDAFQWTLPGSYWKRRCIIEPGLIFELDDLVASSERVDWTWFCLGMEKLMADKHWFCRSGLQYRRRVLRLLDGIKERFDAVLEREKGLELEGKEEEEVRN